MVLAGQDNRFHTRRADCRRPLIRVELLGIEEHRVVVAVAPFGVCECVHAEMDEGIELELMPLELALARHDRRRALYVIVILLHICFPFGYMIHDVYKDNINFARSKLIRKKSAANFSSLRIFIFIRLLRSSQDFAVYRHRIRARPP